MPIDYDTAEKLLQEAQHLQDVLDNNYELVSEKSPANPKTSRATISTLAKDNPALGRYAEHMSKSLNAEYQLGTGVAEDLFLGNLNNKGNMYVGDFTRESYTPLHSQASTLAPSNRVTPVNVNSRLAELNKIMSALNVSDLAQLEEIGGALEDKVWRNEKFGPQSVEHPTQKLLPFNEPVKIAKSIEEKSLLAKIETLDSYLKSLYAKKEYPLVNIASAPSLEKETGSVTKVISKSASGIGASLLKVLGPLSTLLSAIEPNNNLAPSTITERDRVDKEQRLAAMLSAVNRATGRNRKSLQGLE